MPWQLVPEADDRQTVQIDKAILFFGRHPECDVVITSSRKVSRKHCCLAQVDNELVVRDLGSMNGVRVNGRVVRRQARLHLGDTLTVGDVVFHLQEAPARTRPEPSPRKPTPKQPKRPRDVSQDVPVVIPEEEDSFSVESHRRPPPKRRPRRPPSEAIPLSDSDIIDDDSGF